MVDARNPQRDLRLFHGQVLPRLRELLSHWAIYVAIAAGVLAAIMAPGLPAGALKIADVTTVGFTFASIAMGACVSALVLSLGLPGTERLRRWAKMGGTTPGKSALSDLVFVVVWAALCQLGLILVCVLATLFGGNLPLAPAGLSVTHSVALAAGLTVFFYALLELIVVVSTLSQMGVMIIAEEQ